MFCLCISLATVNLVLPFRQALLDIQLLNDMYNLFMSNVLFTFLHIYRYFVCILNRKYNKALPTGTFYYKIVFF